MSCGFTDFDFISDAILRKFMYQKKNPERNKCNLIHFFYYFFTFKIFFWEKTIKPM